jgi:hypothetical protein
MASPSWLKRKRPKDKYFPVEILVSQIENLLETGGGDEQFT